MEKPSSTMATSSTVEQPLPAVAAPGSEQSPSAVTAPTEEVPSPTPSQIEALWESQSGDKVQSPSSPPFDATMIAIRKAQCERERQRDRDSESDEALLKLESPSMWPEPEQQHPPADPVPDAAQQPPVAKRKWHFMRAGGPMDQKPSVQCYWGDHYPGMPMTVSICWKVAPFLDTLTVGNMTVCRRSFRLCLEVPLKALFYLSPNLHRPELPDIAKYTKRAAMHHHPGVHYA